MTRPSVAVLAFFVAPFVAFGLLSLSGCKQEPTIVIKFEPNDMTGAKRESRADLAPPAVADFAAHPPDLAPAAKKSGPGRSGVGKATGKKAEAECRVAADCVVEPLDCCDCANGGKQHAIPKKQAAASKSARQARCKHTVCTMMLSTDPTCGQRPDCVDGACVMTKKK
jgi:hypothetical protein